MMKRHKTIHNHQYSQLINGLCQERKRLGLSQAEVALRLNMNQSEISKIENGERRIDVLEFKELINVYRVNENETLKNLVRLFFEVNDL